jgi:hypothetical protein
MAVINPTVYVGANAANRVHITKPQEWGNSVGTDFWIIGSANGALTTGNAHELADYGWTTTALSFAAPSAADFISAADLGTPNFISLGAAGDLLQSPVIFGDYTHALMAAQFLGYTPTTLTAEIRASFGVASNNETATGVGFFEDTGAANVAADHFAMIASNGANFLCRSGAASDTGAAVDTSWHTWKIAVSSSVEWFIDDVSQGTFAVEADELPVGFGAGVLATTGANQIQIAWAHIWYS